VRERELGVEEAVMQKMLKRERRRFVYMSTSAGDEEILDSTWPVLMFGCPDVLLYIRCTMHDVLMYLPVLDIKSQVSNTSKTHMQHWPGIDVCWAALPHFSPNLSRKSTT
jgi:hypothetical protein